MKFDNRTEEMIRADVRIAAQTGMPSQPVRLAALERTRSPEIRLDMGIAAAIVAIAGLVSTAAAALTMSAIWLIGLGA